MRIVGGTLGSRRLRGPGGVEGLRPTSDRLRETLFDILGPRVAGRPFVDAYAGTGAVGIEAYSRGARPVIWVEAAPRAAAGLRENLQALGLAGTPEAVVWQRRLPQGLREVAGAAGLRAAGGAGFLFCDPPYDDVAAPERLLRGLERHPGLMAADGRVVVETRRGAELPEAVGGWRRQRVHRQGDSQLVFFAAGD
ncbi:MAG TPA: RsmD family RNA methyltransferase [Terriglobales bacterium]|nr:RsmD family RNA methyltransferase [Terriglobales bacterium]